MSYVPGQQQNQPPASAGAPAGNYNWQPMPNQGNFQDYQASLQHPHSVLEFFQAHPHLVPMLFQRFEELLGKVLDRKLSVLAKFGQLACDVWGSQFTSNQEMMAKITSMKSELGPLVAAGAIPNITNTAGVQTQQKVIDTMDLSSGMFLALLTDENMENLQQMHQDNHQSSINQGFGHYDPQQNAFHTDYGMSTGGQNGAYTPNYGPSYGQPGMPSQPYPAAPSGHTGGTLTGSLIGLGLGYLSSPQQQQQQRPYY